MMGDGPWVCRATIRAGDRVVVIADEVYEYRRPAPGNEFSTITADRERSSALALEGMAMAARGWHEVSAAWADLGTPAERHRLDVVYLDRIVRADVAGMYLRALMRRDPACRELLVALADLLRSVPDDVVADARSVGDRLVRPTVAFWWRLPPDARPAFAALLAAARPGGDQGSPGAVGDPAQPGDARPPGGRRAGARRARARVAARRGLAGARARDAGASAGSRSRERARGSGA